MPNNLFSLLGGKSGTNPASPAQMLAQLKSNPIAFLRSAGYSVPDGLNGPQAIINHLMGSGQLSQGRFAQLQQMAKNIKI